MGHPLVTWLRSHVCSSDLAPLGALVPTLGDVAGFLDTQGLPIGALGRIRT